MTGPESYIFKAVVRFLFFLINIFAVYLLLRGHNLPGGGFIAGLASAISLVLLALGLGFGELRGVIRFDPARLAAFGLAVAALTGCLPLLVGKPFLEQFNFHFNLPDLGEIHAGTPLLFDVGVYLVVVGITVKVMMVLAKSTQRLGGLVFEEQARYSSPVEQPIEEGVEGDGEEATSSPEVPHAR
jgi:multicomponent Na+:H+ antiporter subunit B